MILKFLQTSCKFFKKCNTIKDVKTAVSYSCRNISSYEDIPRASQVPIFGAVPFFLMAGGQTYMHKYINENHKKLGPIFVTNLGGGDLVFVSDPDANIKISKSEGIYPKHFVLDSWKLYLEETGKRRGLFFMDDEEWRKNRTKFNKILLQKNSMEGHVQNISSVCKDLMDIWRTNPPADLIFQLYCWTIECTSSITFGKKLGFIDSLKDEKQGSLFFREKEFAKSTTQIFIESANLYSWPVKLARKLEIKSWKRFYKAVDTSLEYGSACVEKAIKDCSVNNPKESIRESVVYKALNEENVDEETITNIIVDLILAAVDTTSYTASWILYLLGRNPKIANKARAEIFSVLENEQLNLKTIGKLKYVNGIIKEALRLYPLAPFISRKLAVDTNLCEYWVPAEAMLISSLVTMGRDPKNFTDPDTFLPGRWWLNQNKNSSEKLMYHNLKAYTPFALGARSCIGRRVAELELSLLIIEALKAFEWTVEEEVEMILKMVSVPSKNYKINLKPINI